MSEVSPFLHLVPRDLAANLRFRKTVLDRAAVDEDWRCALREMCRRDLLFWVNVFGWTYSPKEFKSAPNRPFLTWEFQDRALLEINSAIESGDDLLFEKSRDMGASWMILTVFVWRWLFRPGQAFLMVSRVEDLVDKKNEPDCLFWKVDYLIEKMPGWMVPVYERQKLSLYNTANKSSITGASTTGETGRGGRKTAILLDEFAAVEDGYSMLSSTRDATDCRLINSTPKGTGNAFYDLAHGGMRKLRLHWTEHPLKAKGIYEKDGKPRSPWYDKQCERAANLMEIAQELDIDYLGSSFQYFPPEVLGAYEKQYAMDPIVTGELDARGGKVDVQHGGRLWLWMNLDDGRPPAGKRYALAADVAQGTGGKYASNSVVSVGDLATKEKVAEFATSNMAPHEFAAFCVALAGVFNNALLCWEANGPGLVFGKTVVEMGYLNIWFRQDEQSLRKKQTDIPGFHSNGTTKPKLLGSYRKALQNREYITRCRPELREAAEYVQLTGEKIEHAKAANNVDPRNEGAQHGDRVISSALLWKMMEERPVSKVEKEAEGAAAGSLAFRRLQRVRAERTVGLW